ncbi:hypothetical protein [Microbacterium sp. JZ37]|uniref:hypothetical protein n=1 Tax=Microbacterium sp. JZ37 TaxID=2654193 RepID=UPI002B45DF38|nr:hypothetical protein [Microbacterium sp. JZ37]WRH18372.1 hypothetical protein GC092_13165 [Microbacterium sp. JZ37]
MVEGAGDGPDDRAHPGVRDPPVKPSNQVATRVLDFRERLGIETGYEAKNAKRWSEAFVEPGEKVRVSETSGAAAAARFSTPTVDRATEAFRAVNIEGDGIADKPSVAAAAEEASAALKGAAAGVAGASGMLFARKQADSATDGATADEC